MQTYPPPPPLFKLYAHGSESPPPPPAIPSKSELFVFGEPFSLDDPLVPPVASQLLDFQTRNGVIDFKKELSGLVQELLLLFVDLLGCLVNSPSQYARTITDMNRAMQNLHHLLNSLRPYQARATYLHALTVEIKRKEAVLAATKEQQKKLQGVLEECWQKLDCNPPTADTTAPDVVMDNTDNADLTPPPENL